MMQAGLEILGTGGRTGDNAMGKVDEAEGEWLVGILGVLVLELVLLMFGVGGYMGFLFREDINDMDNNFAWIMIVYDVDAGFFGWEVIKI